VPKWSIARMVILDNGCRSEILFVPENDDCRDDQSSDDFYHN
jgi:hypothetical protein